MNIKSLLHSTLPVATLLAGVCMATMVKAATVLPLEPFNISGPADFEGQVTVDVMGGGASFLFETTAGTANTSIARIYFESGLGSVLSGTPTLTPSGPYVGFTTGTVGPGPNNPPSGNDIPSTPWVGTFERFKASASPVLNGINPGESLMITYAYAGTEADLVAALTDQLGNSRLAVHVLNCKEGDSCVASAVPIPTAVWLFGSGLLGLVGIARRKRG